MRNTTYISVLAAVCLLSTNRIKSEDLSFNVDVRPLLAAKCFACHGPDEEQRQADLRLDVREYAVDAAIVPGKPLESEMVRRVFSQDPGEVMPPPDSNESLTKDEKELLRNWITVGASYDTHWGFVPPVRSPLPCVKNKHWPKNGIDHFVLARLDGQGIEPSFEADRYTLIRRLYLDLIGLPPTPEEVDQFVSNDQPAAYEAVVDQLLESKHYGERWARQWLDLARYSDTNGYEKDRPRSIWPYRDWVIRALNDDMPFEQFSIEQLAGDMLPNATPEQRVATGFHRNTMLNEEGGIDPLEFRFYAMVDRVATTGTVWLGLTIGCVQCHTHKYDPITHTDYYRFMALLNNADEPDLLLDDEAISKRRREMERQITSLEADLPNQFPPAEGDGPLETRRRHNFELKFDHWLNVAQSQAVRWTTLRPFSLQANLPKLELLEDSSVYSSGDITKRDVYTLKFQLSDRQLPLTALRLEVLPDTRLPARGPGRAYYEGRKGDFFLSELMARHDGRQVEFSSAFHSYGKLSIGNGDANAANVIDGKGSTGWSTAEREGESHWLVLNLATPLEVRGELEIKLLFERHFAASLGRFRLSGTAADKEVEVLDMPADIELLLTREQDSWIVAERAKLKRHYARVAVELVEAREPIDQVWEKLPNFPTTMVMSERSLDNPRKSYRHHRGEYLSPREEVSPQIPALFAQSSDSGPTNRLEFARWLVSERNPLVGRVTVNRAWQAFFGVGLVRTSGDFGMQAAVPTHPQLLDWLACLFVDQGWSLKKLHRLIVTSATYRQDSKITLVLRNRDPNNQLLARGPRHRVDAETVRDIMLRASGLFVPKMYGPSVYPPQPESVTALAYGATKWIPSVGQDRYRRSLYTFSKRTAPFAAYSVFDSPSGESCTARRDRSNTPLQALTLLNDGMYLEMAQALARQANQQADPKAVATNIFRRLLTRPPEKSELTAMLEYRQSQLERMSHGELNAREIGGGDGVSAELASWVMLARAVMNLDEAITKP